jgi:hypothetical protein
MDWQNRAVATPVAEQPSTEPVWPTYDHEIGLTEAREMIGRWKRANPESAAAGAFTRVPLDRLLAQKGCVGIRFYYGLHTDGTTALIGVGVDEFGNDLDEGELMEKNFPCPPFCPMDSALDS